jgi:carbonic anhydrase
MIAVISTVILITSTTAASYFTDVRAGIMSGGFDYDEQDKWGGVCVSGNEGRQSPINIIPSATVDQALPELVFTGWTSRYDGELTNNGHSIQFNPSIPGQAMTGTLFGEYALQQVHMHWGRHEGEGSEHTVNGHASELEIHFVHTKRDPQQTGPMYMVIGVFADAVRSPRFGPWHKLDPTNVQYYDSRVLVKRLRFDSLLPANPDYYAYSGSLTTPPCTEEVLWHVMKHKIHVPAAYLLRLRVMQDEHGHHLTHNFRQTQQLNERRVFAQ